MRHGILPLVLTLAVFTLPASHAAAQCEVELLKLIPQDQTDRLSFGESVGISGDVMIAGSSKATGLAPSTGAAYLFDRTTGVQTNMLFASDGTAQQEFGFSVAIDGSLAVIGARYDGASGFRSGAAYIFDVVTGAQLFKLVPSDGQQSDLFGAAVDISGTTVLVGTWGGSAAYLFDATTGAQLAKLESGAQSNELFGYSVGIEGSTAIIGAPWTPNQQIANGAAYVFDVQSFNLLGTLDPPVPLAGSFFGVSVDVHGTNAIVGRPDSAYGRAHLFDVPSLAHTFELQASVPHYEGNFGGSVAIGADRAQVGNSSLRWNDNSYVLPTAHLIDIATGTEIHAYEGSDLIFGEGFAASVALDGDMLAVGSPGNVISFAPTGAAYLFDSSDTPLAPAYCQVNINGSGEAALIQACGSSSIGANNFRLAVDGIPNKPYLFFHGAGQSSVPFGNGFLCVSGDIKRLGAAQIATNLAGSLYVDLPTAIVSPGTRHFQCWFRDPQGGGAAFNLSNAISVTFVP